MASPENADKERAALDLLIRGFQVSQIIRVIADLGLADRIPSEGQTAAADLAAQCGVLHQPLLRMLRALASVQIFAVTPDENVRHTERSRLLRTSTPNSMHHGARFWAGPGSWRAWGMLDHALKGEVPHEAAWGTDRFAYLRSRPEEARVFDDMMAHFPEIDTPPSRTPMIFRMLGSSQMLVAGTAPLFGISWRAFPRRRA